MERLTVSLEVLASHVGFARYHFPIPPGTDCQGLGGAWKPAFEQIPHDHWVLHQLRNLQGVTQTSRTSPAVHSSSPVHLRLQSSESPVLAPMMIIAPGLILFLQGTETQQGLLSEYLVTEQSS